MGDIHLPIVFINKEGTDRQFEGRKLISAFQEYGFCLVGGVQGYDPELALSLAKWFFLSLKTDQKMNLATKGFVSENKNVYRGYFPIQPGNLSYKEGFEAGEHIQTIEDNPLLENTPFPNIEGMEKECEWFKTGFTKTRASLTLAAETLMEMIAEAGGEDKSFFSSFKAGIPLSTHRIIRYPHRDQEIPPHARISKDKIISTGAHVDSGFLTLLETFGQPGLELELDGDWRSVLVSQNLLVVNIGEQLARMSCGAFRATIHRVVDIGKDRISMPFFYEPHCDFNINTTIPKNLLGNGEIPSKEFVPFAAFILKKLVIYAEYSGLYENLPDWIKERYLTPNHFTKLSCWALDTDLIIDGEKH
ncbi:probable iron/ascorbate oxidoreductase DDB_G0283291 [Eurytemora carolleeae]|uniref:probable iron/ascorbate oxidoreductase DDB_G0283291 n=1 Tax=Eurytemora carolleeae TaxID=1294199 RepID=UPI000C7572EB|nr:probable iron/ascorbate oxidoreductase DDB_G0283291 [Eurytemora carolleeae]|eukprot:XP_023324762.1 probable iron/ascorbate oxidoreductase DDB_G0283291 [Eurytemora affinis]